MRLSVTTKIFLGLAAVVLTFGTVAIYSVLQLRGIGQELELVSQTYVPLTQVGAQLESYQEQRVQSTSLLLEQSPRAQRRLIGLFRRYPALVREKLALGVRLAQGGEALALNPGDRVALEGVATWLDQLEGRYDRYFGEVETLFAHIEGGSSAEEVERAAGSVRRAEQALLGNLKLLNRSLAQLVSQKVSHAETQEDRAAFAIMALSLASVLVGLLVSLFVQRTLRPIARLTEGVQAVRRGHFERRVEVGSPDEIGDLAREFNAMAQALQDRDAALDTQRTALLRAERLAAVGRMAAQVAHEIRNPLSSIGLNTELLSDELVSARFPEPRQREEAHQLVGAISKEVDRLTDITESWLRFARMPRPEVAAEDLNLLVDEVTRFGGQELAAAGVSLVVELEPELPPAVLDEAQIRQALLNLMRNAREAMPSGGRLRVATRRAGPWVQVLVEDSGHGIPEADRERIFDPFFSSKEGGTGLGLALTQQIVHEHGGHISLSSDSEGTRFVIELPAADREAAPAGEATGS